MNKTVEEFLTEPEVVKNELELCLEILKAASAFFVYLVLAITYRYVCGCRLKPTF